MDTKLIAQYTVPLHEALRKGMRLVANDPFWVDHPLLSAVCREGSPLSAQVGSVSWCAAYLDRFVDWDHQAVKNCIDSIASGTEALLTVQGMLMHCVSEEAQAFVPRCQEAFLFGVEGTEVLWAAWRLEFADSAPVRSNRSRPADRQGLPIDYVRM